MTDPDCTCPNLVTTLRQQLEGHEPSDCPVHTAVDELAERRKARQEQLDAITDPLERSLTAVAYRDLPLNAPLTDFPSLAGLTPDDAA